jgi:hypothetical protein
MVVSGQLHAPAALSPGKEPLYHWIEGCVGPRAGLEAVLRLINVTLWEILYNTSRVTSFATINLYLQCNRRDCCLSLFLFFLLS